MTKRIIVADDDTSVIMALNMLLKTQGFEVTAVTTPQALVEHVSKADFCAALIDLNYQTDTTSGKEGLALISQLKTIDENMPVLVMTGYSSVDIAVDAMKLGAADFIQKPWSNERLLHVLRTQIYLSEEKKAGAKLASENALLKSQLQPLSNNIVAQSQVMQQLLAQIHKLALSDMNILFTGDNGTGKSMFAQYMHKQSARKAEPFIAVNMGAITDTLFESEMFGHNKGAFTDAKESRIGRFELAQKGTIFLDEIANISPNHQAKLLRVLEERQFEKVGSNKTQHIDVRLISASNADLSTMVEDQTFRQDLLYRLNTVTLHIPSLAQRKDDILPLAKQFLAAFSKKYRLEANGFTNSAKETLVSYTWPGNIRELGHVVERAMFLKTGHAIDAADLALNASDVSQFPDNEHAIPEAWKNATLEQIEKHIIKQRLDAFSQQPLQTADSLGLSRSAYYRRLDKYQLPE